MNEDVAAYRPLGAVDVHVGDRICRTRLFRGLTQEHMAIALGLTVPSLRAIETGRARIDARQLKEVSALLGVCPSFFFRRLLGSLAKAEMVSQESEIPNRPNHLGSLSETSRIAELVMSIHDPAKRKQVIDLAMSITSEESASQFPM